MRLSRIRKVMGIAARPGLWPALAQGVAATVDHDAVLRDQRFATILDVGANKGQFAAYALWRWPQARLVCFEPLPGPRARLAAVTRGAAEIQACALGTADADALIHVASRADSSSMLPLGDRQKSLFDMDEVGTLRVPVRRLDACVSPGLARPALLKIDVQGYELEVLKGATGVLPEIDAVYVEVSYEELYVQQALAADVIGFLDAAGFSASRFLSGVKTDETVVQQDILFTRR